MKNLALVRNFPQTSSRQTQKILHNSSNLIEEHINFIIWANKKEKKAAAKKITRFIGVRIFPRVESEIVISGEMGRPGCFEGESERRRSGAIKLRRESAGSKRERQGRWKLRFLGKRNWDGKAEGRGGFSHRLNRLFLSFSLSVISIWARKNEYKKI